MPGIECLTLYGQIKLVPVEKLSFRPAAYAVLIRDQEIMLLRMKATGKYHLPGGGVEVGERIEDALHREVSEETGMEIQVNRLVDFQELFFYYDPSGRAYHGLHFYYLCSPITTQLIAGEQVEDDSAANPYWVKISELQPEDFQHSGKNILTICKMILMGILPHP